MKKPLFIFLVIFILLSGCNQPVVVPPTGSPTRSATIIVSTVMPTLMATTIPTETLVPTPTVQLPPPALPVCSAETSITGCEVPTVRELDRFCAQEKPYTLYAFPPGTTVEAVTPNFTCNDEGIRKGSQQYSCTGTPSYTFRARVCNTACVAPVDQTSEQCPQGFGVNTANNCCVPIETTINGCAEINLQVGQCG